MLSAAEIADLSRASSDAEAEVRRLEAAAEGTGGPLGGLVLPSDEQRAASAARATLIALFAIRDGAIEDGDSTRAAQVVENLRRLARPGSTASAIERAPLVPTVAGLIPWWVYALAVLVLLVLLAPYARLGAAVAGRARATA